MKFLIRWNDDNQQLQEMERVYSKNTVSIGRNIRNDFCIPDRFVSNYHARVEFSNSAYVLFDLGSPNGISLNGEKLGQYEQRIIKAGDIMKVSDFDIEFRDNLQITKPSVPDNPALHKAAFESFNAILNNFMADGNSFQSEDDLTAFGNCIKGVLEALCRKFFEDLEMYTKLQYELDISTAQKQPAQYNPLKLAKTGKDIARYLLSRNNDDILTTMNFLKEACNDLTRTQMAVLKTLEDVLPALLKKISPEAIQNDVQNDEQSKSSYKIFDKVTNQNYKFFWNKYLEKHKELLDNKNKRFEIIRREFQNIYPDILKEDSTDTKKIAPTSGNLTK